MQPQRDRYGNIYYIGGPPRRNNNRPRAIAIAFGKSSRQGEVGFVVGILGDIVVTALADPRGEHVVIGWVQAETGMCCSIVGAFIGLVRGVKLTAKTLLGTAADEDTLEALLETGSMETADPCGGIPRVGVVRLDNAATRTLFGFEMQQHQFEAAAPNGMLLGLGGIHRLQRRVRLGRGFNDMADNLRTNNGSEGPAVGVQFFT